MSTWQAREKMTGHAFAFKHVGMGAPSHEVPGLKHMILGNVI